LPPKHNFLVELKELTAIPNITARVKMPPKTDKKLGPSKNTWCEFHQAYGHAIRNCLSLGYQLDELVKNGFLKDFLLEPQGDQALAATRVDQGHEVPMVRSTPSLEGSQEEDASPPSGRSTHER